MTKQDLQTKGVLYAAENGAELYLVIGKWDAFKKKPAHHWYMVSGKTGLHCITNHSNRMDERVKAHWEGFKVNQLK